MNKHRHNGDGTTTVFIESKKHGDHEVLIDTEDWERVNDHTWSLTTPRGRTKRCYAKTQINHPDGSWIPCKHDGRRRRRTILLMHHVIMGKPKKPLQTDHIDGNGLNNCKSNLRPATPRDNSHNTIHRNKTGYKGVSRYKVEVYKYRVSLTVDGEKKTLHSWLDTLEEAAILYDKAVVKHREIINSERQLNFPERLEEYRNE